MLLRTPQEDIQQELLVLQCRRGRRDALEKLIRLWERRLLYYLRRLVRQEEDAWDVLQQVWLKVIRNIGSLKKPDRLPVWLYRIARNTARSHWRAKYAQPLFREDMDRLPEKGGDGGIAAFEDAEQVHYGLEQLSPVHRDVLTLFFLEDLSIAEIAEVVGVPVGTVKSRLHHAKQALRAVLTR